MRTKVRDLAKSSQQKPQTLVKDLVSKSLSKGNIKSIKLKVKMK